MADYKTAEILRKASDVLAERGWHQGDFVDPETGQGVCALGAAYVAAGAQTVDGGLYGYALYGSPPIPLVCEALKAAVGMEVPLWNDDKSTTYEDVQLGFKRAIELAESEAWG